MNKVKLNKLLTIKNGKNYNHLQHGNIPVYGSGGIMLHVNDYLRDGESILLPRKGTLNNIQYVNGKFWTVDTIYYTEVRPEINAYFLFNYLRLLNLGGLDSGSTLPSMTQSSYYDIFINLPERDIQDKIARLIYIIDQKIELNNEINAELESMAKTLYDYWFVQFDFPDKNGKPYKSSGGKMVFSEELKREIPEGWEVNSIIKKVKIGSGHPFDSKDYCDSGKYKIITIKNVQNGSLDTSTVDKIDFIPKKINDFCILKTGDILMSLTGNVGRMCFVNQENLLLNQRVGKLIGNREFVIYTYLFFQRPEGQARLNKIACGSSQANLSPISAVKDLFVIPPKQILNNFSKIITPVFDQIIINKQENQKLAELRDWLLPMLMNGQVKIEN